MSAASDSDLSDTNVIANVAWDIFADTNATASQSAVEAGYEIMFWLGSYGRPQPLGYSSGPCLTQTAGGIPL